MTRFLLIRHAHHALVGKALAGRSDSVGLDAAGLAQASALAHRMGQLSIAAVYTSPQRRARETAAPLTARWRCETLVEPGIDEIDFGTWTGRSFDALASDADWHTWVEHRSVAQPPGGERFSDVQKRVVEALRRLAIAHPGDTLALVSHGDVIKAAVAHVLRASLDDLERFDIAPASVSAIAVDGEWARVDRLNDMGPL